MEEVQHLLSLVIVDVHARTLLNIVVAPYCDHQPQSIFEDFWDKAIFGEFVFGRFFRHWRMVNVVTNGIFLFCENILMGEAVEPSYKSGCLSVGSVNYKT